MDQIPIALEHDLTPLIDNEIPLELPTEAPTPGSEIERKMKTVEVDLLLHAGGLHRFEAETAQIIREAVDYVIDAPTLARYSVDELEPDEKTAIGKRIERLLRVKFKIKRGEKLDISLGGEDVDIKTTMTNKWMFSKSSWEKVNLLIAYNERTAKFSVGLVYLMESHLGAENRDSKRTMRAGFYETIKWIVRDAAYPENFLARLDKRVLETITNKPSGQKRVSALLENVRGVIIPRHGVSSVANQHDPLKRIRANGGARTPLWKKGFLVLSGKSLADRGIAAKARNVDLKPDQLMSLHKDDNGISEEMLLSYMAEHKLPSLH
jgi:hypothetical protein